MDHTAQRESVYRARQSRENKIEVWFGNKDNSIKYNIEIIYWLRI